MNLKALWLAMFVAAIQQPVVAADIQSKAFDRLRALIEASDLVDPFSARFRNLKYADFEGKRLYCGDLNSKNRMGAYTGWTPFSLLDLPPGEELEDFLTTVDRADDPAIQHLNARAIEMTCSQTDLTWVALDPPTR